MRPLLSIAIPTYNRAAILKGSLEILIAQHRSLPHPEDVEILVCDNASPDETASVIQDFSDQGAPLRTVRNETNIGPDRNFVKAMRLARGDYVWLLGDDDYLKPGALATVYTALKNGPVYGLVHLYRELKDDRRFIEFTDKGEFLNRIGFVLMLISANIFRKDFACLDDLMKYENTNLIQVPAYMSAAVAAERNLLVNEELLQRAKDPGYHNYNPYKVYFVNYLTIWREFLPSWWIYEKQKYRLFRLWALDYIGRRILGNRNCALDNTGEWRILFRYYWECPYFYAFIPLKILMLLPAKLRGEF